MQLIRLGDLRGINLDMLVSWEIEAPPAPAPAPVAPQAPEGDTAPAEAEAGEPPVLTTATVQAGSEAPTAAAPVEAPEAPPRRLTLLLASGNAFEPIHLEGREAEAMHAYLQGRSGALIR